MEEVVGQRGGGLCTRSVLLGCWTRIVVWCAGRGKTSCAAWSIPRPHTCSGCCCLPWIWPGVGHHPIVHPQCSLCRGLAECKSTVAPTPALPAPVGISGGPGHLCFGTVSWLLGEAPASMGSATQLPSLSACCGRSGTGSAAPGTLPVPSILFFLVGVVAEVPWLPSHLPFRNQGGGEEQANFFHVYNRAQECFCFMATVIAH